MFIVILHCADAMPLPRLFRMPPGVTMPPSFFITLPLLPRHTMPRLLMRLSYAAAADTPVDLRCYDFA